MQTSKEIYNIKSTKIAYIYMVIKNCAKVSHRDNARHKIEQEKYGVAR